MYFTRLVAKEDLFSDGYIAQRSGHSRGSTIDLTIVDLDTGEEIEMGTPWDFFDPSSWPGNLNLPPQARANRNLLNAVMTRHGFRALPEEWWHFTLENEPFADNLFRLSSQIKTDDSMNKMRTAVEESLMRLVKILLLLAWCGPLWANGKLSGDIRLFSEALGYDLQYRVYEPEGMHRNSELPTLYITDGQWYISRGELPALLNRGDCSRQHRAAAGSVRG